MIEGILERMVCLVAAAATGSFAACVHDGSGGGKLVQRSYRETAGAVPNPERGMYQQVDVFDPGDVEYVAGLGVTLGNARIRLDDFRDGPISDSFLRDLQDGFDRVREAGLKLVLRFQYNDDGEGADAPLERVLGHIEQLAPLLRDNADVLAVVQAGFIGAWGEWHGSTNGLETPEARKAILGALLDALPPERMVQVRTPEYKEEAFPGGPVGESHAFSGEQRARVGLHDDCFLGSDSDEGTYDDPIGDWKDYVAQDGRFTAIGGESCHANRPRSKCATARKELRLLHFSYLNRYYSPDVIEDWKSEGCFDEIRRDLGYRFVLRRASWSKEAAPGGELTIRFTVESAGYAAPYNPRPVYAVLGEGADRVALPLEGVDPRLWTSGETTEVEARVSVPDTLSAGVYRLSLWLPDPSPSIRGRPEYALRFANEDTWDPAEGTNVLTEELPLGVPAP